MLTSNLDKLFTIKKAIYTRRAGNHQSIFYAVMSLSLHRNSNTCRHTLALACNDLVSSPELLWSLTVRQRLSSVLSMFTFPCLHSRIYKYKSINTKLGPNVYDHKISDEFQYGSNRTRTVRVVCPWIRKYAIFDFVYTLASANIDQSVPNLATIFMPIRSQMSMIMGQIDQNIQSYMPLNLKKLLNMTSFTLFHLKILTNQHQTWSNCMWL